MTGGLWGGGCSAMGQDWTQSRYHCKVQSQYVCRFRSVWSMPQPAGRSGQMKLKWFMQGEALKPYNPAHPPTLLSASSPLSQKCNTGSLWNPIYAKMFPKNLMSATHLSHILPLSIWNHCGFFCLRITSVLRHNQCCDLYLKLQCIWFCVQFVECVKYNYIYGMWDNYIGIYWVYWKVFLCIIVNVQFRYLNLHLVNVCLGCLLLFNCLTYSMCIALWYKIGNTIWHVPNLSDRLENTIRREPKETKKRTLKMTTCHAWRMMQHYPR